MKVWELRLPMPPDLGQLLDPENSPINPKWFPYGSFPLYLLKLTGHLLSLWRAELAGPELRLVGRAMSALFDTGTALLVYLIGSRSYGRTAGLLASAFAAFSVIHIQTSHFFTADLILTFFVTATVLAGLHVAQTGTRRASLFMGMAAGLGMATKISIAPILVTIFLAHLLYVLRGPVGDGTPFMPIQDRGRHAFSGFVAALSAAVIVFFLAQPYALIDQGRFLADSREQSEMAMRIRDYPYTRQYEETLPYLYQVLQSTKWGLGVPLGIVSWLGLGFVAIRGLISRRTPDILILSWVIPYFVLTGGFPVKFMRYMLPLTPFLMIMGAEMLSVWSRTVSKTAARRGFYRLAPTVAVSTVLLFSILYSVAFLSIYSRPHSAVQLSQWINRNVPKGSTIAKEHWEEGLPDLGGYQTVDLQMYEADTPQKLDHIVFTLGQADYIVFYSSRLYGSIPRLPDRYPMATEYYTRLFGGELGYTMIAYTSSYPGLAAIAIADDTFTRPGLPSPVHAAEASPPVLSLGHADESFTVYDHPLTMLFKKDQTFSQEGLRTALASSLPSALPKQEGLVFASQEEYARHRFQGTGSELFPMESLGNKVPLLSLLVIVEATAILVLLPLSTATSHLPDKGFMLAKIIGILSIGYIPWLLSSLKVLPFTRETIGLTILAMSILWAVVLWKRGTQVLDTVRSNWKIFAVEEAVFIVAFLFLYQVRVLNPDLWHPWRGGEKPMDFAYLNALVRSQYMPPYDPWFAGGYLNYYYFGQVIIASIIKLAGIVPSVAYNLAVPLLFALSAGSCFSIAYNMVAVAGLRLRQPIVLPATAAGLAAVIFVLILGNVDGGLQLAATLQKAGGVSLDSTIPGVSGLAAWVTGTIKIVTVGSGDLPLFDYWRSSRMMAPAASITEFPYFTFLFADLHAHLISIPFTLGIISIFWALISLPPGVSIFKNLILLLIAGWMLGAVRWINSWDYPTYLILGLIAIGIREYLAHRVMGWRPAVMIMMKFAVVLVSSLSLYLPLSMSYELFYSGVQPTPETTKVQQYLAIHGLFLFVVSTFLAMHLWDWANRTGVTKVIGLYVRYWWKARRVTSLCRRFSRNKKPSLVLTTLPFWLTMSAMVVLGIGIMFSLTASLLTLLSAIAVVIITSLLQYPRSRAELPDMLEIPTASLYAASLFLIALLIGVGVELVAIKGDIGRMNTVFKFYLQAWVLYGIGSAYALWWLFSRRAYTESGHLIAPRSTRLTTSVDRWRGPWSLPLAVLVAGTLVYPIAATPMRVGDRFVPLPATTDGMAYMEHAVYQDEYGPIDLKWDYDAILWMQDNLRGTPVIMEGVTPIYRWGSRVSVYTGLPTVIGWDWHQKQQRWGYQWMVDQRVTDVSKAFGTIDQALALSTLKKYEVEYVFIGQLERLYYPEDGINKFYDMERRGILSLVYGNQEVNIFRVVG